MKDLYKQQLVRNLKGLTTRTFSNSNKDLYKLLLKNIFLYSENHVNWFITNVNKIKNLIDEELQASIKKYLENKKINIIVFDSSPDFFFTELKADNLIITKIKKDLDDYQEILTWDNHGYRFAPNGKKYTAICCANDELFTKKCDNIFQKFLDSSKNA